ncbi:MAG: hypothetical protein R3B70_34285 [Polyangiaceae bacterium]
MRNATLVILRSLALAALGAAALLGGAGCGPNVSTGGDCTYDGKDYEAGESFPAGDGCNSCTCEDNGSVACTEIGCEIKCEWQGQLYSVGETFPAGDGCNSCTCEENGEAACTLTACPQMGCSDEGYFHAPGEGWESNDKCTACTCQPDGQAICSDNGVCESCYYAGQFHEGGESFPALDGCNTCQCTSDGGISCTEIACACDTSGAEWWHEYVGIGDECQVIDFGCDEGTTMFSNQCGCGCEQPSWCPQYFDCQPPSPCDTDSIHELCPYSGIAL